MQVAGNELINLVENEKADFRSIETSRCSEEGMQLLWSTANDVWHVLLQKTQLLTEVTG